MMLKRCPADGRFWGGRDEVVYYLGAMSKWVIDDRSPRLCKALAAAKRKLGPRFVKGFRTRSVLDSVGNDALALWVLIGDDAPKRTWLPTTLHRMTGVIGNEVFRAGFDLPLVYFRTVREQKQLDKEERG
jgi:hypothetical protein